MVSHDNTKFIINSNGNQHFLNKIGISYINGRVNELGESESVWNRFCLTKKREIEYCKENNVILQENNQIQYIEFNLIDSTKNDYICEELNKIEKYPQYFSQMIFNLKQLVR